MIMPPQMPPNDVPKNWVPRLAVGNWIWLVKEQEHAMVASTYCRFPLLSGRYRYGQLGIQMARNEAQGLRMLDIQKWDMTSDGRGMDGLPLVRPLKGHLLGLSQMLDPITCPVTGQLWE